MPQHPLYPKYILILSTPLRLDLPIGRFPSGKKGIRRKKKERKKKEKGHLRKKQSKEMQRASWYSCENTRLLVTAVE
jgi:hypothetical protein